MNPRLVGDPIDVVTGANVDRVGDLYLAGPFPLDFNRYYNSANCEKQLGLGWGHSHELEHQLVFNLDGIEYQMPSGNSVQFPMLDVDDIASVGGFLVKRTKPNFFQVTGLECTMHFGTVSEERALLARIGNGKDYIEIRYDKKHRVASATDSASRELAFEYERGSLLKSIVWVNGRGDSDWRLLEYSYDEAGNLSKGIDQYGNQFSFKFDSSNRLTRKTDRRGHSFHYDYDRLGRCVATKGEDGLHDVKLKYLPELLHTEVIRGDGGKWFYFFSEEGDITRIIAPDGGATIFTHDDKGNVVEEIDPGGTAWTWEYGSFGERIGKRNKKGFFKSSEDGDAGFDPLETELPTNAAQREFGHLANTQIRGEQLDHDDFILGRRPPRMDPLEEVTESKRFLETEDGRTYDHFGNLVKQTNEQGQVRRWSYDSSGCMTKFVDRDGAKYHFEYDSWNILSAVVDPLGNRRTTKVNGERYISEVVDASGHAHHFGYDQVDRLTEVRRFDRIKESYEHDLAGNLTRKCGSDGRVLLEKTYGPANLVEEINITDGETFAFNYDDENSTTIDSGDHQLTIKHDAFGQRSVDLRSGLGVEHSFAGVQLLKSTVLDNFTTTYEEGPDGLTIVDPTGGKHTFVTEEDRVIKKLANGATEVTVFDPRGLIREKTTIHGTETWTSKYEYSGEGYLMRILDSHDGETEVLCDQSHRLKSVNNGSFAKFRYDQANNLLEKPGLSGVVIGDGNQILQANDEVFEYNDRNSINLRKSNGKETQYEYDGRDQLTSVKTGSRELTACYDVAGRRVRKCSAQGDEKCATEYYWDSNRLAAKIRQDQTVRVYVYSDQLALIPFMFVDYDGINSAPESGKCFFLRYNHLGAPVKIVDSDQEVVWSATYDAYGQSKVSKSDVECNMRLPGHYLDRETGLHYNRYRYYDPVLGRYIQADPIGLGGGTNLYAYCLNPSVEVDIRGLGTDPPCGGSQSKSKTDEEESAETSTGQKKKRSWEDLPEPIRRRIEEGNEFNRQRKDAYDHSEVYVEYTKRDGTKTKVRVDSYNHDGEIVERKHTQLSEIQEDTGKGYINQLNGKYPEGATISDVPSNAEGIRGQSLNGQQVLEVPPQQNDVPQAIKDHASERGILIRDSNGKVYNPPPD